MEEITFACTVKFLIVFIFGKGSIPAVERKEVPEDARDKPDEALLPPGVHGFYFCTALFLVGKYKGEDVAPVCEVQASSLYYPRGSRVFTGEEIQRGFPDDKDAYEMSMCCPSKRMVRLLGGKWEIFVEGSLIQGGDRPARGPTTTDAPMRF